MIVFNLHVYRYHWGSSRY